MIKMLKVPDEKDFSEKSKRKKRPLPACYITIDCLRIEFSLILSTSVIQLIRHCSGIKNILTLITALIEEEFLLATSRFQELSSISYLKRRT